MFNNINYLVLEIIEILSEYIYCSLDFEKIVSYI